LSSRHPKAPSWLTLAEESLQAANTLRRTGLSRPAASRFYYAAYQAAHAILLCTPVQSDLPERGNWDHPATMNGVVAVLRRYASVSENTGRMIRVRLARAYSARVQSDYAPDHHVRDEHVAESRSAAAALVGFAQRMVHA
jgi:uncharacterized protein (UPF0332 family)